MANLTLPRDPATAALLLPGLRTQLSCDFLLETALPAWLTATADSGTLSTAASGQGDLVLATAATANATARLQGPSLDLSGCEAVLWEIDGLGTTSTGTTVAIALGVAGSGTVGAVAKWAAASTTGLLATPGAAAGSGTLVAHNVVGTSGLAVSEAGRRRNLALLVLPKRKHAYLLLGDQVVADADLTTMTTGSAYPYVELTTTDATAVGLLVSRTRLTVWKSTARVALGTGTPLPGFKPSAMSLSAVPGDAKVTLSRSGGDGSGVTYSLYRGTAATGTPIATGSSIFPYTDTGLTNGTAVSYIATAANSAGTVTTAVVSATPSAAAANPVLADTFTASDGTAITGRSAAEGTGSATWAVGGVADFQILSGAAVAKQTTTSGATFVTLPHTQSAYRVRGVIKALLADTAKRKHGLLLRYNATTDYVRLDTNGGAYVLRKVVGGTATSLITGTGTPAAGDVVEVTDNLSTGALALYVNGAQVGSTVTDTALTANKNVGLYGQGYGGAAGAAAQDATSSWDSFALYAS